MRALEFDSVCVCILEFDSLRECGAWLQGVFEQSWEENPTRRAPKTNPKKLRTRHRACATKSKKVDQTTIKHRPKIDRTSTKNRSQNRSKIDPTSIKGGGIKGELREELMDDELREDGRSN